jgi:hypothetical protein
MTKTIPDFLIWHCAGCGRAAVGKKKPCDSATNVGTRAAPNGGREQTWWDDPPDVVREALDDRQRVVIEWGERCFGADHMQDKIVRSARFFEEAAELVQAVGLSRDHAMRAFNHVYSREPGEPMQEVGGVANTLMALCGTLGLSFDVCQIAEIERCLAKDPSHFAKRNEAKLREVDTALTVPDAGREAAIEDEQLTISGLNRNWELMRAERRIIQRTTIEECARKIVQISLLADQFRCAFGLELADALRTLASPPPAQEPDGGNATGKTPDGWLSRQRERSDG